MAVKRRFIDYNVDDQCVAQLARLTQDAWCLHLLYMLLEYCAICLLLIIVIGGQS